MKNIKTVLGTILTFAVLLRKVIDPQILDKRSTIFGSFMIADLFKVFYNKYFNPYFIDIIFCLLIAFLLFIVLDLLLNNNYRKELRQKYLDDCHYNIFKQKSNQDSINRITYFERIYIPFIYPSLKRRRLFWGIYGHYLVIDTRTGKYRKSHTQWPIHEDKKDKNKGIAGMSWYHHNVIEVQKLPDLNVGGLESLEKYCQLSYMTPSMGKKLNVKSRSFLAIPIENFKGSRIGVVVIDSLDKEVPKKAKQKYKNKILKTMSYLT